MAPFHPILPGHKNRPTDPGTLDLPRSHFSSVNAAATSTHNVAALATCSAKPTIAGHLGAVVHATPGVGAADGAPRR
jgi:hypothetical protein